MVELVGASIVCGERRVLLLFERFNESLRIILFADRGYLYKVAVGCSCSEHRVRRSGAALLCIIGRRLRRLGGLCRALIERRRGVFLLHSLVERQPVAL